MKKKTIVFDFDGVIHIGYKGWKDGSIYGGIDTNLIDYIKILMKDYYIVISSNRPAEQIVEFMNELNLGVKFEVFKKDLKENMYWSKDDVIGVTNEKAVGILYIDDRGYRYIGLDDLQKFMEEENEELKKQLSNDHQIKMKRLQQENRKLKQQISNSHQMKNQQKEFMEWLEKEIKETDKTIEMLCDTNSCRIPYLQNKNRLLKEILINYKEIIGDNNVKDIA